MCSGANAENAVNRRAHFRRDDYGVLKMRATMDHTVSHDIDLRSGSNGTRLPITQRAQQMPNHLLARGDRQFFF